MLSKKLTFFLLYVVPFAVKAQPDTMIVYHTQTHTIDTVFPVTCDTSLSEDHTGSAVGSLGNQVPLSLTPPLSPLFASSNFSDIQRAELFFDVTTYPFRTAASMRHFPGDAGDHICSSVMVGPSSVLTAAHCVYDFIGQSFLEDSILVVPGYNNGEVPFALPVSMVRNIYLFKTFYDKKGFDDIALLELMEPIGLQTGWIGMAYNSNSAYYTGKVFHKLSYPAQVHLLDPSRVYNGDTLYYNYGYIDVVPYTSLGVQSADAVGIPGQSGSPLFYTDNTSYYSFGVFSFSNFYQHYPVKPGVFCQLKNIVENYATPVSEIPAQVVAPVKIYPLPFSTSATFEFKNPEHKTHELEIYNSGGQLVQNMGAITGESINITRGNLPPGIYFFRLSVQLQPVASGKITID